MKILLLLGLEIQSSSFIYNRVDQYYKNNIDFDIYQPYITRNKEEYDKAEKSFNFRFPDDNVETIIYTPKGMREGEEQLCFPMYRTMLNAIENEKYDLIVAHWTYPHGYVAYLLAKELNIPCVIVAHGSDIHTTPYYNQDDKKYKEIRKFTVKTINNANGFIFVSNYLKSKAKELNAINENATIIPNGIDSSIFKIIDKMKYRKIFNYSLEKRYIIYAGNLEHVKGSDFLIPIYKKVLEKYNNVDMFIVGNGHIKDEMLRNIHNENLDSRVHYINYLSQNELSVYIGMSDLFILPSRNEGWPCVVNESLACGVPVVGSSVQGIVEAVGDDTFGSIVDKDVDYEVFINNYADIIVKCLNKEYDKITLREKALKYTWNNQCKLEIEFMEKIFSNNTR